MEVISALLLQVHADQAQHRLIDDAKPRFHGRLRGAGAAHAQVNRDVEHAGAFRENPCPERRCRSNRCGSGPCAPAWLRAGWERVDSRRRAVSSSGRMRRGASSGMGGAEHPLIAAHRAHTAPHLVGQSLKTQRAIARGQRAGNGGARTLRGLGRQERYQSLPRTGASEDWCSRRKEFGDARRRCPPDGNVKAVYRVQEKERAHTLVEVVTGAPETVERLAFGQQILRATRRRQSASSEQLRISGSREVMTRINRLIGRLTTRFIQRQNQRNEEVSSRAKRRIAAVLVVSTNCVPLQRSFATLRMTGPALFRSCLSATDGPPS